MLLATFCVEHQQLADNLNLHGIPRYSLHSRPNQKKIGLSLASLSSSPCPLALPGVSVDLISTIDVCEKVENPRGNHHFGGARPIDVARPTPAWPTLRQSTWSKRCTRGPLLCVRPDQSWTKTWHTFGPKCGPFLVQFVYHFWSKK